jgi:serine/threonine protein kinase
MAMMEVLADELEPGTIVAGRYVLDRVVGEGGMGVVWAAKHAVTGKPFALKFLKESKASDPKSQRRLLREAKAACAVRHPAVAEVLDVLELDSGAPFLVMDLLEGETLTAKLTRQGTLSADEARAIFVPVVDALRAAHDVGIVHRDLKPENVFLARGPDGATQVKVVDFGIAKVGALADSPNVTETGDLVGTPMYMAPEVVFGELDVDGRADVWALGVMLYEAFAGAAPTSAATVGLTLKAITREAIRPLSEVAPATPPELAAIVGRMLSQERDARPPLVEVRRALEGESVPAEGARTQAPEVSSTSPDPAPLRHGHGPRPLHVALGAAPILAAVAIAGLVATRESPEPRSAPAEAPSTTAPTVTAALERPTAPSAAAPPSASAPVSAPTSSHVGAIATVTATARAVDAAAAAPAEGSRPVGHDSGIILSHDRK